MPIRYPPAGPVNQPRLATLGAAAPDGGAAGPESDLGGSAVASDPAPTALRPSRGLPAVLAMLMTTGWAANHFAALLPVLRSSQNLSASLVAGLYGLYAVGLLPGLLLGGTASDRIGRRAVAVPGALLAAAGTLILLVWHDPTGLVVGRLIVGAGAGATFSAGTAWAADLGGAVG